MLQIATRKQLASSPDERLAVLQLKRRDQQLKAIPL